MTIAIRLMDDINLAEVAQLFHDAWHETQAHLQDPRKARHRDIGFFQERMKCRANTVVAYRGDQLAGFVSWTGNALNSLFVQKGFRNQSVGLLLMSHAETAMFAAGHTQLELDCVFGNDGAKRFYERHGWELDRIAMHEREKPEGIIFTRLWRMVKRA
jgi:GNAT superfamily N-acetyltransferase